MNRLLSSSLAFALAVAVGSASAQSYDSGRDAYPSNYSGTTSQSDYARVIRVDPVFDSGYTPARGQRCYDSPAQAGGSYDPYRNNRSYDGYRDERRNGYYDQNGNYRTGSQTGSGLPLPAFAGAGCSHCAGIGDGTRSGNVAGCRHRGGQGLVGPQVGRPAALFGPLREGFSHPRASRSPRRRRPPG